MSNRETGIEDRPETSNWRLLGKLTAALAGPVVGSLAFTDWVKKHPILALGSLLVYEAGLFCAGILGELWKRVKDLWLDNVARWIDSRVQEWVSGCRRRYLEHVVFECRNFDVKGLSTQGTFTLKLQHVFVELSVDPEPVHEISQNPIPKMPAYLQEGRHDIWEYLAVGDSLALVGAPGSGKTTLLRHIALVLSIPRRKIVGKPRPNRLPILLFLRRHAREIAADPNLTLATIIESSELVREIRPTPPAGWFQRQLGKNRCLILLDGLDEVADKEVRVKLVKWLEVQIKTYGKNQFVVTSRPHGYRDNPLTSVHTLTVRPFSSDQVHRFVANWYLANEIVSHNYQDLGVRKEAEKGTRDLLRRINGSEVLSELAVNPLLLTMIATVHKYRSELPGRRVELYREICEVFLGKRHDVQGVERSIDLTPSQKQCVLEPLAYFMMSKNIREISANHASTSIESILRRVSPYTNPLEFFRMIENNSGLLLEKENGEYAFSHKTFQEYLTALHCRNQHMEKELVKRVKDDWWHETIRLYVAQADATQILRACFEDVPPDPAALALAVECIEEAQQVDQECRQQLETLLAQEAEDERHQRIYGEALLRLRLRKMVSINEKCWADTRLVTNTEYQVYLDELRTNNIFHQPDHWTGLRFPLGEGGRPITTVRASDAQKFCDWLTAKEDIWLYRLPHERELLNGELSQSESSFESEIIDCWALSASTGQPVIANLSLSEEDNCIGKIFSFAEQLWLADVAVINKLVHSFKFYQTQFSGYVSIAEVVPFVLGLDKNIENLVKYDRTIDSSRTMARSRVTDFRHAVERVLSVDLEQALSQTQRLNLRMPDGQTFSSYLNRANPIISSFADFVDEAQGYPYERNLDLVTTDRLRSLSGKVNDAIASPLGLANLLSFVPISDGGRDLDHVRAAIVTSIGYWTVRRLRLDMGYQARLDMDSQPPEPRIGALFDLYLQLAMIEGRKRKQLANTGGIRIVRERLEVI